MLIKFYKSWLTPHFKVEKTKNYKVESTCLDSDNEFSVNLYKNTVSLGSKYNFFHHIILRNFGSILKTILHYGKRIQVLKLGRPR